MVGGKRARESEEINLIIRGSLVGRGRGRGKGGCVCGGKGRGGGRGRNIGAK